VQSALLLDYAGGYSKLVKSLRAISPRRNSALWWFLRVLKSKSASAARRVSRSSDANTNRPPHPEEVDAEKSPPDDGNALESLKTTKRIVIV